MKEWSHRYRMFARAHGRSPEAQLEHETAQWPGGKMCGFILWIHEQWRGFWKAAGYSSEAWDYHTDDRYQNEFDAWLDEKHTEELS